MKCSYIPPKDQCQLILGFKFKDEAQLSILPTSIRKILKNENSFPIISSQNSKSLNKICNSESQPLNILKKVNYFIFDQNRINQMNVLLDNRIEYIEKAYDYFCLLILHLYLSFTYLFDGKEHLNSIIIKMFQLLLTIIAKDKEEYKCLAKSAFTTILITHNQQIDFMNKQIFMFLIEFFNSDSIPNEAFKFIVEIVEKSALSKNEDNFTMAISLLKAAQQRHPESFNEELISKVFSILRWKMIEFNESAFALYNDWAEVFCEKDMKMLVEAFPLILSTYFKKDSQTKRIKKNPEQSETKDETKNLFDGMKKTECFEYPMNLNENEKIPKFEHNLFGLKKLKCKHFFSIVQIVKAKNGIYIDHFINKIIENLNDQHDYYEIIALYIHFLIYFSPIKSNISLESLFSSSYFSMKYLEKDLSKISEEDSSICNLLITLLSKQEQQTMETIFNIFLNNLAILPEICYRFLSIEKKAKTIQVGLVLLSTFSRLLKRFSQTNENSNNNLSDNLNCEFFSIKDVKDICCTASLLTFAKYFEDMNLRNKLFDDFKFSNLFLPLLEMKESIDFAFDQLSIYFDGNNNNISIIFVTKLVNFFQIIMNDTLESDELIENNENQITILYIVRLCAYILNSNPNISSNFAVLLDQIGLILPKLKRNETTIKIFKYSFNLFASHKFTLTEASALEASALSLYGLTNELRNVMFTLLGASDTITTNFIIKQPKAALIIYNLFDQDKSVLSFLTKLCHYSPMNSLYFHTAGLDSLLIKHLFEMKSDETKNEIFEYTFSLFCEIAQFASSIGIVNQFMSLLCADTKTNKLSNYHLMLVNGLLQITEKVKMIPTTVIQNTIFKVLKIQSHFNFSINICVFLTKTPNNQKLFTIYDSNSKILLELSFNENNIGINTLNNSQSSINYSIITYRWIYFTFNLENNRISIFSNGTLIGSVSYPSIIGEYMHDLNKNYSFLNNFTFYSTDFMFIGSLTTYNLDSIIINDKESNIENKYENISEKGARQIWGTPTFAIRPHQHNMTLDFELVLPKNAIFECNEKNTFYTMSFIDILAERCGATLIIPLLAQIDMENANEGLLSTSLELIKNLLILSVEAQKKFVEMNGFAICSRLLALAHEKHINYSTFYKFYEILTILKDEKAISTILKFVLLNLEIWVKAYKPKDLIDIMKILSTKVFAPYLPQIDLTFNNIVSAIRIYFSFLDVQNVGTFKGGEEETYEIRKLMIDICRIFVQKKITNGDFLSLLAHLICSSDLHKENDLLNLASEIIKNKDLNIPDDSKLMMSFLLPKCDADIDLAVQVIKSVYDSFSNDDSEKRDLNQVTKAVYVMMREISDYLVTQEFADRLIQLVNQNYPLLFSMAAMVSADCGLQQFHNFLSTVHINSIIYENDGLWPLFIIVGIFSIKGIKSSGLNYLLDAPYTQWELVFTIIEVVNHFFNLKNESKCIFLKELYQKVDTKEKSDIYIRIARRFLFIRSGEKSLNTSQPIPYFPGHIPVSPKPKTNSGQVRLQRRSSSFFNSLVNLSKLTQEREGLSMNTVDTKIADNFEKIKFYSFNIRFQQPQHSNNQGSNEGLRWYDVNIAKNILELLEKYPNPEFYDDIILIEAFRLKYSTPDKRIVNKEIFNSIENEKLPSINSISFYNEVCQDFSLVSPFQTSQGDLNRNKNEDEMKEDIIFSSFEFFDKKNNEVIEIVTKSLNSISNKLKLSKEICENYNIKKESELKTIFTQTVQDYVARVGLRNTSARMKWSHFCSTLMSGTETPWHYSVASDKIYYKRDKCSCFTFCPYKLKINKKYDQHLLASYQRDTGNSKTAQQLYDKFLSEYKSKQKLEIFEFIEDQDESDPINDVSTCVIQTDCEIIKISKIIKATFILYKDSFVTQTQTKTKKYSLKSIDTVLLRTHLHRHTAIEIFMKSGTSLFINFLSISGEAIVDQIYYQTLDSCEVQMLPFIDYFKSKEITESWINHQISNFEYLVLLNIYSGRSFNNASQYPFLPWIVFDYDSDKLTKESIRPLEKPIGAINEKRLQDLLANYEEKKISGMEPFLYSSGPMAPLALFFWLVREEPITTYHIEMQSGSFDSSDRIFISWKKAYELCMNLADNFRELPPEAFFSPEFLSNSNDLNFGVEKSDVELPPWAKTPIEFVYKNRKILESDFVSNNLNNWIDLIWGVKQRGKLAIDALNTYRPEMYSNIWDTEQGIDEMNIPLIETYLSQVGQIPQQLFSSYHPKKARRNTLKTLKKTEVIPTNIKEMLCTQFVTNRKEGRIEVYGINENGEIFTITITNSICTNTSTQRKQSLSPQAAPFQKPVTMKPVKPKTLGAKHRKTLTSKNYIQPASTDDCENKPIYSILSRENYTISNFKESFSLEKKHKLKIIFTPSKKLIFVGNCKNETFYVNLLKNSQYKILQTQNRITNLATDEEFSLISAFDSDGFLSVLSAIESLEAHQQIASNIPTDENVTNNFNSGVFTIPSFHEKIKCSCISRNFHQIACGTKDGSILVASENTHSFIKTIRLEKGQRAKFISISPCWGFIFAVVTKIFEGKTKTYLSVWTVNGDYIRSREVDFTVTKMITFRSRSGFDYFLLATKDKKLISGEIFDLEFFYETEFPEEILSLAYDNESDAAFTLSKDGYISIIPCAPPEPEF
ncbi:hypothetical protein TRFO_29659 [Tritrichomonas foetus]|uniref:Beige/BEACH domain containing protein n=1 Tax=Tritrichomonas foetus TaxID=1144522 RepID=A0A1J4JWJ3_9EUKA|nr:hypothetical protein TRFO_29659 [Tritrichomonas foetus]|eukprot:OHT03042.1 hypothetical protein TRFO_29659 [Tritrichomonas foetus]